MDSKSGVESNFDEGAAPPSYIDTVSPNSAPKYQESVNSSTAQYFSQQIKDQLDSLNQKVTSLQTQKNILKNAQDEKILSLLTTQIQIYLSEFAESGSMRGTLTLLPAHVTEDETAVPACDDLNNAQDFVRIMRIRNKEADVERIRDNMFWEDGEMAERLAAYLQPAPSQKQTRLTPLPPRQEQVAAEKKTSSGSIFGWGRKKTAPPPAEKRIVPKEERMEQVAQMQIRAQEVVFRTENEYGLYETQSGWGIVLTLGFVLERR